MTDPNADMPTTILSGGEMFGELVDMPPAVGWVVHQVVGKPQQTQGHEHWAWCKVTVDEPGYSEIIFTEPDGSTPANPYPKATPDSPESRVRLGPVLFKVFC